LRNVQSFSVIFHLTKFSVILYYKWEIDNQFDHLIINFPCVIQNDWKTANFERLYYPHFTTFRNEHFCPDLSRSKFHSKRGKVYSRLDIIFIRSWFDGTKRDCGAELLKKSYFLRKGIAVILHNFERLYIYTLLIYIICYTLACFIRLGINLSL
jgi:hypothetical protein